MTRITPEQSAALNVITDLRRDYIMTKGTLEMRLRQRLEAELREAETRLNASVHAAYVLGVPKTRIGTAYGTKDAGTINRILAAHAEEESMPLMEVEPFQVTYFPESGKFAVHVDDLMLGEDHITDAHIEFVLDEIGFPMFTNPADPWENSQPRKIGVLARKIQMDYNSDHPLNKSIRAAKS